MTMTMTTTPSLALSTIRDNELGVMTTIATPPLPCVHH